MAYCFRTLHPLVVDLAQGAWIRFIRQNNLDLLGERADLGEFLFGAPRGALDGVRSGLTEIQNGECFYCRRAIQGADDAGRADYSARAAHVDHFIPWSRYPVDLGHNFVIAHDSCNGAKADHLSAPRHLERWESRNEQHGYELSRVFAEAGTPHDLGVSRRITRWAYRQVEGRGGLVWEKARELVPLEPGWEKVIKP